MEELFFRISLGLLIVAFFVIRAPSVLSASKTKKVKERKSTRDRFLVLLNFIGMMGLPIIYILTPWLDFFAYPLPEFVRYFGIIFNIVGLILLVWIHRTLGQHWSMMLELGAEHKLVTTGPYAHVRHPMYTFFYILAISTALISANVCVGLFGIIAWTILYTVRVEKEEDMLLEQFGEEYKEYMERTGRLVPKFK
jgi:protein-S-isoprenylcysteine O-methyltransferase Ste14